MATTSMEETVPESPYCRDLELSESVEPEAN